jgi:hypothetical protein
LSNAPNTNSTLSLPDGRNKTSTAISTNIIILVNNTPVGAVQSLQITESRNIKQIDEVGTDGHVDSVPNQSTNVTGTCQRVRFDRLRITEAFSRGFVHVKSQQYPFDIVILDKQKRDQGSQISTIIKNVWIKEVSYTYQVSDWTIVDSMNFEAEDIFSILNNGSNVPVAVGGELGIRHSQIPTEALADTGGKRGSLDGAGLIDLASSIPDLF